MHARPHATTSAALRRNATLGAIAVLLVACSSSAASSPSRAPGSSGIAPASAPASAPATVAASATTTAASSSTQATTTTSSPAPTGGGRFSVGLTEPTAIDPALTQEAEGGQVTRLLFETLVTLSPDLQVVSGVATTWSVAADGVTWTFHLDPAASFSDGTAVRAQDFAFSFARSADPDLASPAAYQGSPIKGWDEVASAPASGAIGDVAVSGVTAVDDHTLTVVTSEPFSLLPKVLTYPIFAPVNKAVVDTTAGATAFTEQPVGNGPYMLTGPWRHHDGMTLVRNPHFHGHAGVAEEIDVRIYADPRTEYRDFQAGNLDIARDIAPEDVEQARAEKRGQFVQTELGSLSFIGFPTTVAPFDDPAIRTAMSLAIDRTAIAERVWSGTQVPATGMVPPNVPGALAGPCDACTYDPVRAKAMFDRAGGIPGGKLVVYDNADDGQQGLDPILNSWRQVFGLDIEVRSYPFSEYLDEVTAGKAEGPFELGWAWDYPSAYSFLSPLFESTSGVNNGLWKSAAFDAALESARTAADEQAALHFLTTAQQIVEADMPIAPITFTYDLGVYSNRLSSVTVDAAALWRLESVSVVG